MDDNDKFHAKRALHTSVNPGDYNTLEEFREAAAPMYLNYLDSTIKWFDELKFWYTYKNWCLVVEEVWKEK